MKNVFYYDTPIGKIGIADNGDFVTGLFFGDSYRPQGAQEKETPLMKRTMEQLREYFSGARTDFDVPVALQGTEFQTQVWKALMEIPYGKTCTYGELAARIGNPKASRAVGMANNRNPVAIIVPCHRVIGASGKLVGYGGGLNVKERLLELERKAGEKR